METEAALEATAQNVERDVEAGTSADAATVAADNLTEGNVVGQEQEMADSDDSHWTSSPAYHYSLLTEEAPQRNEDNSAHNAVDNGQLEEAPNINVVVQQLNDEVHALISEMQAVNDLAGELIDDDMEEFYGFPENQAIASGVNDPAAEGNNEVVNAAEDLNIADEAEDVFEDVYEEDDSNSTTNSNMSLADADSDGMVGVEQRPTGRWLIPQHHVNEAIGELISQARRSEGGIAALLDRDNFMQRVRSMIFSLERNRNRRTGSNNTNGDGNGGDANGDGSMDSNGDGSSMDTEPVDEVMQSQSANDSFVENEHTVRFDTNLPAEHSYFGPNLNRVPGVNYLDVGGSYRMLIFMHQHLLFPGEVLPFMINGSIIEEEEENGAWGGREGIIFGIVFPFLQEPGGNALKLYGVTCQIYERGEGGHEMVFFKSRALQRFVADCDDLHGPPQYIATNPRVKCYGVARILPEVYLPEPLNCVNMGAMNRYRDETAMRDKFRRFQAASTPWPAFVYNEYSISDIVDKAREKLEKHKIDTMPNCPIQLSFWLVRNLHLTEKLMHSIFMTDSVNVRLKMIGRTFKGDSLFYCRYCNNSIAQCHELFAMSKHGVQTQYCNSAGYIHETNTVYRLLNDSVTYRGKASTEFSWFPGYQWRIIVCKFCTQHIGWEYKAIEPNLVPKVFFGLAGSSVRISKANNSTSNNMRPFVYRNLLRLVSRQME